ncbi:type VII toxin-antitoxin system HepT family RNase toxin [Pseudonocardia spinosispora]|uniref:type VII toxin-antitoxin system HepT family RNase toxin n=1 Tax=Pseudonocardia spinosispora TaxID=103441 RepID=UPI003CCB88C1
MALAERSSAVESHLRRMADHLSPEPDSLRATSADNDATVLHLSQAIQIASDLALSSTIRLGLCCPATYGDAFRVLGVAGIIDHDLSGRLVDAAEFRDVVVHAYADLDLDRVHAIATHGPADLRALLVALRDHSSSSS